LEAGEVATWQRQSLSIWRWTWMDPDRWSRGLLLHITYIKPDPDCLCADRLWQLCEISGNWIHACKYL
jgi:hypothetical protein